MNHRTSSRLVAGLATIAVAASITSPAVADPSPSSAAGAGWLATDLEDGLFEYSSFPAVDFGLNLDAGFALVQAGDETGAADLRDVLEPETDGYITGESFGDAGSTYANAVAKLLAFVEASGGDPTDFDGKDLVARLEAQVGDGSGDTPDGALFDTSIYGNNTNTLGQSFAAQGLAEVGSAKAGAVTSYLLAQQCDDGHFPLGFRSDGDDTCDGSGSVDVTSLIVVALRQQGEVPAVATALADAAAYIAANQADDGSFGGAPPTTAANANTTGLAAWALGETCDLEAAYAAADWTRTLQVGDDQAGTELAEETGAIAYDQTVLDRDEADGIADGERDQYRRSTSQATNGLAYDASAEPTIRLSKPKKKFWQGGSTIELTVKGIDRGDAPCLITPGGSILLDDSQAKATTEVTLPRRTSTVTYTATTGPGLRSKTAKVLGAKKFPGKLKAKKIPVTKKQRITVRGLAKGESVAVRYQGRAIERGVANKKGTFSAAFDVVRMKGKQRVQVFGEFGNRNVTKKFRVTRR